MSRRVAWLLPTLLLAFSCPGQVQGDSFLKLKSGKQVKVLGAAPVYNTIGKRLGFMFKYETELKVTDKAALRKEAEEVFAAVRPDVEKMNESSVIVSAVEKASGFISKTQGYNFVYERLPGGSWHCLDDKQGP
jgi:hypothetical protein